MDVLGGGGMGATGLDVEALVGEGAATCAIVVEASAGLMVGAIGLGMRALVVGGGGMVPTTGEDIIAGTIGITGAASASSGWPIGCTTSLDGVGG